jgi:chromosome segregation ATPase
MTNEEMEKTMQFILEQQAQFTANFQKIEEAREKDEEARKKDSARITRLEESFQLLVQLAQNHDERLVTLAEAQIRVSEQIAATDEQIAAMNERTAETDERLNALIAVVERYISSKGQNGSPQG